MHHIATNGNQLIPSEKVVLIAFLLTHTDTSFIHNSVFVKPDKFPDDF